MTKEYRDEAEYVKEKGKSKEWFVPNPDKWATYDILDKYKSPITLYTQHINMEYDNGVLRAVQKYFPDIDKDELAKALKYDRDQYKKGYTDGVRDMKNKMMEAFNKYTDEYIIYILNKLERKGD